MQEQEARESVACKWWEHPDMIGATCVAKLEGAVFQFEKRDERGELVATFYVDAWTDAAGSLAELDAVSGAEFGTSGESVECDGCGELLAPEDIATICGDGGTLCVSCDDEAEAEAEAAEREWVGAE